MGWSLDRRSTMECGVSEYDHEASIIRRISTQISPQSSVIKKIHWNTRKGELHWTLDRSLKHFHASGTKIWERNCTDWSAKLCYKQVDKPIFVPPKPTGNMPSVLSDAYRLDYIQHESITNKGTWILVQNTRSPNYRTCYAFQLLGIKYSSSNWLRFNKQNTSIWLKTQTKIVTTHNRPAGYG